jgi:hypothetical protein
MLLHQIDVSRCFGEGPPIEKRLSATGGVDEHQSLHTCDKLPHLHTPQLLLPPTVILSISWDSNGRRYSSFCVKETGFAEEAVPDWRITRVKSG